MLETSRLLLRPAIAEDNEHLFLLNNDPEVMRYTADQKFVSSSESRKFIEESMIPHFQKMKMGRFMVFLEDGTFIGWCGLKYFPETAEVDLGYRFLRKFWGKGYASESSKACLNYGFNTLGLKRIIAKAMPGNIGSIKVLQKLGMTFRGYVHDPTDPQPFILFELSKAEYRP